jgi:hypothetical protein
MVAEDLMEEQAMNERRLDGDIKRKNKKGAGIAEPEKRRRLTHCTFLVYPREHQGHMMVDHLLCRCQEAMEPRPVPQEAMEPRPVLQEDMARRRTFLRGFQLRVVMAPHPAIMSDTPLRRTAHLLAFRSHAARAMVADTRFRMHYLLWISALADLFIGAYSLYDLVIVCILTVHGQHLPPVIYKL